jgi:hypothetical protein
MAQARFALLARPELRVDCSERESRRRGPGAPAVASVSLPPRLPPLGTDAALPDEDVVTVGMELPLTSFARAFEAAAPEAGSGPRFHVTEATVEAMGRSVTAELTLAGEVCGVVALRAELGWQLAAASGSSRSRRVWNVDESSRLRQIGPIACQNVPFGVLLPRCDLRKPGLTHHETKTTNQASRRAGAGAGPHNVRSRRVRL